MRQQQDEISDLWTSKKKNSFSYEDEYASNKVNSVEQRLPRDQQQQQQLDSRYAREKSAIEEERKKQLRHDGGPGKLLQNQMMDGGGHGGAASSEPLKENEGIIELENTYPGLKVG